ncbi:hypothetical protein O3M35_007408 [Rhynocoris fuscipes]|uniref:Uncharacterized protein n=1 Tax=Rhynocoris fuscipes TaxID=488301 RepID=A0AAW1D9H4_9HEMI
MEQNVNALSQFLTSKPLINVPNYCENKEPVLFCNSPREKQINYYNSKKKNDLQYANEFRSIASNYNNTPTKTQSELRKKYLELLFPEQNHLNRKQYFYNDLMQNTPINDIKRVNNYSQGIYTNAFRNLERFNNKGSPMEFYSNRTVNALPNNQFHLLRSTMIPSLISYENKNYSKQVNHCPEVHNEPKSHKKISCGPVSICHPSGGLPKCPKPALAPDPKNYQYSQFLTGEITERIVKKILEKAKSNMLPELGIGSKNFSQIRTNNYINITMCGGPCSPIYGEPKKFLSWLVITNLRRKPRLTNYYNIKPERNFLFDHKFLNPWPENVKRDVIAMPQSLFGFQQQPMYGFGDEPYTSKLFYDSSRPEKNNKFIYRSKIVLFPE